MKKLLIALAFALSAPSAFACSAMSPEFGFVRQFDTNQDGQLSRGEFVKIKTTNNYKTTFKTSKKAFARLDKDKNGKLSYQELAEKVDYVRHPCADWEEKMTKMAEEHEQHLNTQTIEIYKEDGSRQCQGEGIDPKTMANELGDMVIHNARKDQLNRMYPSVCGGATGSVNVFTIDKADLQKAKSLGFEVFNK